MALVDIITLIEREASEKAASLIEAAEAEVKKLVSSSEKKAKLEASSLEEDGKTTRETLEKRKNSEFARNERVAVSTAQQEIVDSIFVSAKEELKSLSGDDLTAVFVSLLEKIDADKGTVWVFGGKKPEMESAVKTAQKDFSIEECTLGCDGGFTFEGDGFEMDFSFSALIEKELRPTQEGKIFKELF